MGRTVSWFSCGAASAVATKISNPDVIAYCDTGAEDPDNARFMRDCERWFGKNITVLKSAKYTSTWDVWQKKRYISGIAGAPCTGELKIAPRLAFERPDDTHIFGYTADKTDAVRAHALLDNWPDMDARFPLLDAGLNKSACMALVKGAGIALPRVYALGYPNANCIPCCKATSPAYWALVRKKHPDEFNRMAALSRKLGARLARVNGERVFIDDVPDDQPPTGAVQPECDLLCQIAERDMGGSNAAT